MLEIIDKILLTAAFLSFVSMVISVILICFTEDTDEVEINIEMLKLVFSFSLLTFVFTFIIGIVLFIWT